MQNVESGTRGHNLGRQVKNIYAKPAFFYKNSLVYTSIEVILLVSFPLLSVLIVAERVNFCESYTYVISIIIQLIEGFIISFIFYNYYSILSIIVNKKILYILSYCILFNNLNNTAIISCAININS